VLAEFQEWLGKQRSQVMPKSALGKAMTYCRNQWEHLIVFLKDKQALDALLPGSQSLPTELRAPSPSP